MSKPQPDSVLVVGLLAVEEMGRRLEDEEERKKIPTGALSKVIADCLRIADKQEKQEDKEESQPFDLWDEIDTFPPARRLALAIDEVLRLEAKLGGWHELIRELEQSTGGVKDAT